MVPAHGSARPREKIQLDLSSRARVVAIAGFVSSLACVAILHLLRTDLPPVAHRLSEYANGSHGWMMAVAFSALGCGLIALGVLLRPEQRESPLAWTSSALAFLAGAGTIVSGIFRTNVSDASELVHSRASALASVALVVLCLAYSIPAAFHRSDAAPDTAGTVLALTAAILAAVSPLLHDTRLTGLSQRLLWIVLLAWLLRAAWNHPSALRREALACSN